MSQMGSLGDIDLRSSGVRLALGVGRVGYGERADLAARVPRVGQEEAR